MRWIALFCLALIANVLRGETPLYKADSFRGEAKYEIWMPGADDPVVYNVELMSHVAPLDSFAPCKYIIVSRPADKPDAEQDFSAYFDGNLYRFRGGKLSEWNFRTDPLPFEAGLPKTEMFTALLPQFIDELTARMATDSAYIYNVETNGELTTVSGSEERKGIIMRKFTYRFTSDGRPLYSEITTNPDTDMEQIVTADYTYNDSPQAPSFSLEYLKSRFPEVFSTLTRENFSVESLVGKSMPSFALPSPDGRIFHNRGEGFDKPTLIVVSDDYDTSLIDEIQQASADVDIIYAFTGNDTEAIADLASHLKNNEKIAFSARSLINDCGIKEFPTLIYCNSAGTIDKILSGVNKGLSEFVKNIK